MKKFILTPFLLAVVILSGYLFINSKNSGKGALQVTSVPKSNVYLNGNLIGQTPLCKCEAKDTLATGDYTIRLDPQDSSLTVFEEKISIVKSVLTVVDRTFSPGAQSSGSIIGLSQLDNSKEIQLLVASFPSGSDVLLDNSHVGVTPLLLKNTTESDHEVKLQKDGYADKTVRIKTIAGYKLTAQIFLGVSPELLTPSATPSAQLTPSLSPSPSVQKVIILQTPTGFLRVRESSSLDSAEIARVNPGDIFEMITQVGDWVEIKLKDGTTGWVSAQYVQKQ